MGQFIKFTFASCLGVLLAMALVFFLVLMIALGAASAGQTPVVKANSVLKLDIDYAVPEHTNNTASVFFNPREQNIVGIQDILDLIEDAAEDPKIAGIYVYPVNTFLGPAQTSLLCEALQKFKASGKWIIAYGEYYRQGGYALAAQADTVMLNPIGSIDFRGYAAMLPFFKDLLDKTGLKMQIYYAGEYKGATEPYRRNNLSPENRFQTKAYLDDAYGQYLEKISQGRNINTDRLYEIANTLLSRNAEDAKALGLIDLVAYEDEAHSWMKRRLGLEEDKDIDFVPFRQYFLARDRQPQSSQNRIAVVYAEGEIVPGKTDFGTIGDERYAKILRDLRRNDRVKAVVLRVNSPGGSILAAENILRELSLLKAAGKPVVASMGDYAASGGYYISALADSIFAEPTTLTGSIGVFTMIPNFEGLLDDKLGVHFDTVRTGDYSAAFTPFLEWSDTEHTYMQERTDAYYDLFLSHVSNFRNMTKDEVHEIAKGRIWSGMDAVHIGLVDDLGDLQDAIDAAAALAGIEDYRTTEYPRVPDPFTKLIQQLFGQDDLSMGEAYLEDRLVKQVPYYKQLKALLGYREPIARLPLILTF